MSSTQASTTDLMCMRAGTPADRPLYQVLEQRAAGVGAGALMGSDHTYVLPPGEANRPRRCAALCLLPAACSLDPPQAGTQDCLHACCACSQAVWIPPMAGTLYGLHTAAAPACNDGVPPHSCWGGLMGSAQRLRVCFAATALQSWAFTMPAG